VVQKSAPKERASKEQEKEEEQQQQICAPDPD
jgi:hypothetical protein